MAESMICPFPERVRSNKATTMPKAHNNPPPAKSPRMLAGNAGISFLPMAYFHALL
jgi:hypothetical protein